MEKKYLDRLIEFATSPKYQEELIRAKDHYNKIPGRVHDDEPSFENRMNLFINWYIFDWIITDERITFVDLFFRENESTLVDEENKIFSDLRYTLHSLFILEKRVSKEHILLIDLFDGERLDILDTSESLGIEEEDLFEARIIPVNAKIIFAPGFCIHPIEIIPDLKKIIKRIKFWTPDERFTFIQKLSSMKLKMDRYKHLSIDEIYDLSILSTTT